MANLCYNQAMRFIAVFVMLSFLVTGYAAAAHAFGFLSSCPKSKMSALHMGDCCDHSDGNPMPPNCLKCDCCAATVSPVALTPDMSMGAASLPSVKSSAVPKVLEADFIYCPLRPPNFPV